MSTFMSNLNNYYKTEYNNGNVDYAKEDVRNEYELRDKVLHNYLCDYYLADDDWVVPSSHIDIEDCNVEDFLVDRGMLMHSYLYDDSDEITNVDQILMSVELKNEYAGFLMLSFVDKCHFMKVYKRIDHGVRVFNTIFHCMIYLELIKNKYKVSEEFNKFITSEILLYALLVHNAWDTVDTSQAFIDGSDDATSYTIEPYIVSVDKVGENINYFLNDKLIDNGYIGKCGIVEKAKQLVSEKEEYAKLVRDNLYGKSSYSDMLKVTRKLYRYNLEACCYENDFDEDDDNYSKIMDEILDEQLEKIFGFSGKEEKESIKEDNESTDEESQSSELCALFRPCSDVAEDDEKLTESEIKAFRSIFITE